MLFTFKISNELNPQEVKVGLEDKNKCSNLSAKPFRKGAEN